MTEEQAELEGRQSPMEPKKWRSTETVEGPYVHGAGKVTSDQCRATGMREPGGVVRTMVLGGAKVQLKGR